MCSLNTNWISLFKRVKNKFINLFSTKPILSLEQDKRNINRINNILRSQKPLHQYPKQSLKLGNSKFRIAYKMKLHRIELIS